MGRWGKTNRKAATNATYELDKDDVGTVLRGDFNAKGFGADPANTAAENTTALQLGIDTIAALPNGGTLELNEGTYLSGLLTLKSKVRIVGQGPHRTILKLGNGANSALLQGENFASLTTTNGTGGIYGFALEGITFDGNKANNTGGIGLRWYGYDFHISDVVVRDFDSYGIWSEWCSSGANPAAADADFRHATMDTVTVHTCDNEGIYWSGPPDAEWHRVIAYTNGTGAGTGAPTGNDDGNIHVIAGGNGLLAINCHAWSNKTDWAWKLDARAHLVGCCGEAGRTGQVLVNAGNSRIDGGEYFGDVLYKTVKGIVIGTSGHTIAQTCLSWPAIRDCESGAVDFTYSAGLDIVAVHGNQSAGTAKVGTVPTTTLAHFHNTASGDCFSYVQGKLVIRLGNGIAFDVQNASSVSQFNVDLTNSLVNSALPIALANAKFVRGTTTGGSSRRILGLSSDDNVYVGDVDNNSGLRVRSGAFEAMKADGASSALGFYGATSVAKQTVTGSRGGNAALASLLTALAALGLITDSST